MTVRSFLASRVDATPLSGVLAIGDVLAVAAFVIPGMYRHGFPPPRFPIRTLDTFAPFLLGWLFAALLGGLYTRDAIKNPRRVLSWTLPAWVLALLVGHGLRATPLFHGGTGLVFFGITLGIGATLGVLWRVAVSLVVN